MAALPATGCGVDFGERFARDAHGIDAGRDAAINRDLQKYLADLGAREAVGERALDVDLELVRPVECGDHAEIQQAAIPPRETRASPHAAPAVLGRQLDDGSAEIVGSSERL